MNYQEFKEAVIKAADAQGIKEYELYYQTSDDISVSALKDEIKSYNTSTDLGVCLRGIVNGKMGYASTEHLSEEEAESLVARVIDNAGVIEAEEQVFIHKAGDTYSSYEKKAMKVPTGDELISQAQDIQKALYEQDSRVLENSETATGYGKSTTAIYNTNGLDLQDETEFSYAYAYAILSDGKEMYPGIDVASGDFANIDATKVAKGAVEEAVSSIGYQEIESGKYDVVISSKVMHTFLATFSSIFSAEAAQKGMSLLAGKEGEVIAAPIITITDDPMEATANVKRSFDAEGVATYKKDVVKDGKLMTLLHNLKTANVAGVKSTGNASKAGYTAPISTGYYSFYINPGKGTCDELMAQVGNGVYLTDISGLHAGANPVTGDFSLLSEGFKIENGKKGVAIKNFTVSGNFFELLKNITVVGEELKFTKMAFKAARCGAPDVIVPEMSVAGK